MTPVFFSEIESFPSAVLKHHWPHIPNLGDLTKIDGSEWKGKIDILWGSTPCQAFSPAGKRAGLNDKRGALSLGFVTLADEIEPDFVCWENVKGVLSDKTNAFGCLLAGLAGEDVPLVPPGGKWSHAGYVLGPKRAVAWRLFDAQHGGVPQRRERVFLVASPRNGPDPRELLFEREGVRRDSPPSRKEAAVAAGIALPSLDDAGQGLPVLALTATGVGTCGADDNQAQAGHLVPVFSEEPIAFSCKDHGQDAVIGITPTMRAMGHGETWANAGGQLAVVGVVYDPEGAYQCHGNNVGPMGTLRKGNGNVTGGVPFIAGERVSFGAALRGRKDGAEMEIGDPEISNCLRASQGGGDKAFALIREGVRAFVRRLTPRECERLQGFPDDHTKVAHGRKPIEKCPDGPRYKAIGNSLAVPDVRWIGERIIAAAKHEALAA